LQVKTIHSFDSFMYLKFLCHQYSPSKIALYSVYHKRVLSRNSNVCGTQSENLI